jgi:glycosyltransferase involved in cell wall biosynthesis
MNVLLVNISLDSRLGGGTAERTRHLALNLSKAGCHCEVMAITGNSWQQEFDSSNVKSYITGKIGKRFPLPLINPIRAWKAIKSADIIHIMGYWNLLSIAVGALAVSAKTPYVLCPAGEFSAIGNHRLIMRLFHALFGKQLIKKASGFIAITQLERSLISEVAGIPIEHISVIPNAVSEPSMPARLDNEKFPRQPFILFMGRLAPVKGPDFLVQAYINTPAAHKFPLVLAGPDFGMQKELQEMIAQSELSSAIHFIGFLNEEERNEAYRRALMLVIPSRSEAMSLVALEAGIVELPVLLTNTCGFNEIEEVGGGLVVAASAEALSDGLNKMLVDVAELEKMGKRLKRFVVDHYSWQVTARAMIKQFEMLIRTR